MPVAELIRRLGISYSPKQLKTRFVTDWRCAEGVPDRGKSQNLRITNTAYARIHDRIRVDRLRVGHTNVDFFYKPGAPARRVVLENFLAVRSRYFLF